MFDIILLYILCALTFTLSKATLAYTEPFFFTGFRMILAGLLLIGLAWWRGQCRKFDRSDWWLVAQVAFFGVFIAYGGDLWTLQFMSSCESSLVYNLTPFASAFLSYLWFGERMTPLKWLALLLGFSALAPLVIFHETCYAFVGGQIRLLAFGVLVGVVVAASYGWIVVRELVKVRQYGTFWINGCAMVVGGMLAMLTSFVVEGVAESPVSNWSMFLFLTAATIVVANGLFINYYSTLLRRYTATLLSLAGLMTPLIVSIFGLAFLGEPLTYALCISTAVFTLSFALFYYEEWRQGYLQRT